MADSWPQLLRMSVGLDSNNNVREIHQLSRRFCLFFTTVAITNSSGNRCIGNAGSPLVEGCRRWERAAVHLLVLLWLAVVFFSWFGVYDPQPPAVHCTTLWPRIPTIPVLLAAAARWCLFVLTFVSSPPRDAAQVRPIAGFTYSRWSRFHELLLRRVSSISVFRRVPGGVRCSHGKEADAFRTAAGVELLCGLGSRESLTPRRVAWNF